MGTFKRINSVIYSGGVVLFIMSCYSLPTDGLPGVCVQFIFRTRQINVKIRSEQYCFEKV